jgi:hypothetical protein
MKNYFKNVSPYIIVILVMIIALILTKQCHKCPVYPEPTVQVITETDTVYDTIEIVKTIYKPLPKDTLYIEISSAVDTTEILKDYYAKKYYNNIYMDDTSAYIAIEDTVFKNELYTSKLTFVNRRPTVINSTTYITQYDTCKPCKSFNMGFGGFVGFSGQDFISGGSIMLTTNKKASYAVSVGYMFNGDIEKYKPNLAQFTIYWNIK